MYVPRSTANGLIHRIGFSIIIVIDDTLLAVTLLSTGTDIIDVRDGTVVTTYHFGMGGQSILEAGPISRRILLEAPYDPENETPVLELLPVSAITGN